MDDAHNLCRETVFTYVHFTYINSTFISDALEKAREDMEDQGAMSDEQIDQAMKFTGFIVNIGVMTAIALFGNSFIGAIPSLIVAAIVKKEKPAENSLS